MSGDPWRLYFMVVGLIIALSLALFVGGIVMWALS